jgi:hypothetical protein
LIAAEKTNYPVAVMCRVLNVSRTGFHNWERRAPSDRVLTDAWLTEKIEQIHDRSRGVYGAPRIHAELRMEHGIRAETMTTNPLTLSEPPFALVLKTYACLSAGSS